VAVQVLTGLLSRVVVPRTVLFSRTEVPAYPFDRRSSVLQGLVRCPPSDPVACVEFVRGVASRAVAFALSVRPERLRTEFLRTPSLRTPSLRTPSLRTPSLRTQSMRTECVRPKSLLAPTLLAARRAASAKKCERIAERLAGLAAGRTRTQVQ
jgi:hypothetical protein